MPRFLGGIPFLFQDPVQGATWHLLITSPWSPSIWVDSSVSSYLAWPWHFWRAQVFCRMPLKLGLCDACSWLDLDYMTLGKTAQRGSALFVASYRGVWNRSPLLLVGLPWSLAYSSDARFPTAQLRFLPSHTLLCRSKWVTGSDLHLGWGIKYHLPKRTCGLN